MSGGPGEVREDEGRAGGKIGYYDFLRGYVGGGGGIVTG